MIILAAMQNRLITLLCCWLLVLASATRAAGQGAHIRIVGEGAARTRLSLDGLEADATAEARQFMGALTASLMRAGWFDLVEGGAVGVAVAGTVTGGASPRVRVTARNPVTGRVYLNRTFQDAPPRRLAHQVCDAIVEAVKGVPGIASLRVAAVGSRNGRRDLYLMDMDGGDLVQLTHDGHPCLSPDWFPDGRSLVYMSMHRGFPDIYRIDLDTMRRSVVSAQSGLNVSPAVSPDGRELALTLSRDGNPELYVMTLRTGRLERLTRTPHAAEASPAWSPDGRQLVYVSDTTGRPQLYVIARAGGPSRRITYRGTENVNPHWGPDGRIVFSSRRDGQYRLCVIDPATGEDVQVTQDAADYENPFWLPNGRHVLADRTARYKTDIYLIDTRGDAPVRLTTAAGDWYSPAATSR